MSEITVLEVPESEEPRVERAPPTPRLPSSPRAVRVLHVINGEHYAGAERVQDLLALRLPEFGYEVGFACVKPDRFPELRQSRETPLYELRSMSRFDPRAMGSLLGIIRREGYEIVHAHTPRSLLAARPAALLAGVPLVYHVHSPTSRDTTHRLRNWLNTSAERACLAGVPKLIAVSESLGRHMQSSGFAASRVSVVHNGVPAKVPPASRAGVAESIPARQAGTTRWTLGTVALFRPRKGLEVLLDSLALLRKDGHDVVLRAIGSFETPAYEAEIKLHAKDLNILPYIEWTGFTRDVNTELARLDLFVLPSLFGEGLPMVVLEAMAAGVPIVATRVEGVPEAIRDGLDGLLAAPGDPADLAASITRVVRGETSWLALRESALIRHREHFSDRSMAAGVARVYDEVLSGTRK